MLVLGFVFSFVVLVILYHFVTKLEEKNCECSDEVRRPLVKRGAQVLLALNALAIVASLISEKMARVILVIISLISFPYFFLYTSYIMRLRAIGCGCSDMPQRNVLFWYSMYCIGIYTISIVTLISFIVLKNKEILSALKKYNQKK